MNTSSAPTRVSTDVLRDARDRLREMRTMYEMAVESFSWPDVGPRFNFVHAWFDRFARDNDRPGLVIMEEDGRRAVYSFAELVTRSEQVAVHLAAHGVGRGDSVMVILGNQIELWESMLALIRLGAVIMPTTTALGPAELVDRIDRGAARAVICNLADASKFDQVPGEYIRVAVGGEAAGWIPYSAAYSVPCTGARRPAAGNSATVSL